ncbi:MAG TPA: sugar ABC transporter permease [Elusimicrobia bacterium]|jgi:multiple sugar transport system permease protein|nr:sugar ABC transporter permease [Elusimicrobiota bacterium]
MKEERKKIILILLISIFMLSFCLLPVIYMVIISLSKNPDFLSAEKTLRFTLKNYFDVLSVRSLHFTDYLKNSIAVSTISAALSVFIAALAAYSITRLNLPGKVILLFFVLVVSMFPQISLVGWLFKLMAELGWINTYPALILPYIGWILPLSLWILVSYFSQLPKELDKQALIDGCSRWQILFKVLFPVALPGLFSTFLLAFIFAFNEFMFALMLTADHKARTIPVGIALFQGLHGEIPWGNIMSAATIATLPVIILTIVFQKRIVQGLTRGAVKG